MFAFYLLSRTLCSFFFFFNDTATTEIYTLSLHDALPISHVDAERNLDPGRVARLRALEEHALFIDRKSTRLNSSHSQISYAVFCLKKKKKKTTIKKHTKKHHIQQIHIPLLPHTPSRTQST